MISAISSNWFCCSWIIQWSETSHLECVASHRAVSHCPILLYCILLHRMLLHVLHAAVSHVLQLVVHKSSAITTCCADKWHATLPPSTFAQIPCHLPSSRVII